MEIKAQLEGGSPLYRVGLVFKLRSPSLVARAFTYYAILMASFVNSSMPACMHACILSCVVVVVCVCVEVVTESRASFVPGKDSK